METNVPVTPVAPVASKEPNRALIISIAVVVLAAIVGGVWWFMRPAPTVSVFPIIENGETVWYAHESGRISLAQEPEDYVAVPSSVLSEGDFSAVYAQNGSVVTLSLTGLTVVEAQSLAREDLIERANLDYGSSVIAQNASAAALYNADTNAIDLFLLDSVRPLVLAYVGSVSVETELYGVGFVDGTHLIVRTGQDAFLLYTFSEEGIGPAEPLTLGKALSWLSVPVAHAWTYSNPPTATNAVTASARRCTGAVVANLGTASGSGAMPSVQTTVWSYMPNKASLPANYNNGTYCIQAVTTVTTGGGPGGGGGGGDINFEHDPYELLSRITPTAQAQANSWSIAYTAHSGTATAAAADTYTLTYTPPAAAPTASLVASPTTVNAGSAAALTWSSTGATSCTGTGFSTGSATSGTVSVSPSTTTTYSVSCTGTGGTTSDSETLTVVLRPNLVSGSVSVPAATAGTAVSLQATVSNSGVASTGAGFSSLYQRATSAAGANVTDIGTHSQSGALVNGSSVNATLSYAFPSAGTWYVRVCADKSSAADAGAITESNESDNCSGWTSVTVSAAPAATVTASLSASPQTMAQGGGSTLTWSSTNAGTCLSSNFQTGGAVSGSVAVTPLTTIQYDLTCYGETSGGSGQYSTPWVEAEWWSGTQTLVYRESLQNDGSLIDICKNAVGSAGYPYWNEELQETETVGDSGYPIARLSCYGLMSTTGTTAKPYLETGYCNGLPGGNCSKYSYRRSGDPAQAGTSPSASASATVTVSPNQCFDGSDNDGDGQVDAADPGCTDDEEGEGDGTESTDEAELSCTVSSAAANVGDEVTYTASPANLGTYTWNPQGGATCEAGTGATKDCVLPIAGDYLMSVTAGGVTAQCYPSPVSAGCDAGTVSISAAPDRVRAGNATALTWSAGAACTCTVTGTNGFSSSAPTGTGVATTITGQTRFGLSCNAGSATDSVIVNVVPEFTEF